MEGSVGNQQSETTTIDSVLIALKPVGCYQMFIIFCVFIGFLQMAQTVLIHVFIGKSKPFYYVVLHTVHIHVCRCQGELKKRSHKKAWPIFQTVDYIQWNADKNTTVCVSIWNKKSKWLDLSSYMHVQYKRNSMSCTMPFSFGASYTMLRYVL